jgi:hypothetical protein
MAEQPQRPSAGDGTRLDRVAARLSTRRFGVGLFATLAALLVLVMVVPLPFQLAAGRASPRRHGSASPSPPAHVAVALEPAWPRRITFLTDSVGLGAIDAMRQQPGWIVRLRGQPALMIHQALSDIRADPIKIEHVVVVALGYNSLWQHRRRDYAHWAAEFDGQVIDMLRYLRHHGARKVVWVTLRTPHPSVVPADAMWQYRAYAWYFPYVNEQLKILDRRFPDLVLADWSAVSDRPGITYDAIHLDTAGQSLYAKTVWHAILHTPFGPGT